MQQIKLEKKIIINEGNIKLYRQNYQNEEGIYNKYLENKESVESLTKTFGVENLDALLEKLETEKNAITKNKNQKLNPFKVSLIYSIKRVF